MSPYARAPYPNQLQLAQMNHLNFGEVVVAALDPSCERTTREAEVLA